MIDSAATNPIRPGAQLELDVHGLNHSGDGVARLPQGQVCFVPGALPGERVSVRLRHPSKRHWQADLIGVLQPSPSRCKPTCILAEPCGGCTLQHWQIEEQSHWKQQLVVDALQRLGHLQLPVQPLLRASEPFGYRNRAVIPLKRHADDGRLRAGYYRRGSHRIVNMNHCPVLDPRLDALIAPIKQDLHDSGWPADADAGGEGGLRHLALRIGAGTGELLITLISSHDRLPGLDALAAGWMERWPALVGVCLNLQPHPTNTLMGETTLTVTGLNWLHEQFAGLRLRIAADTFFQVNTQQASQVVPLLSRALSGHGDRGPGLLVDAYCGIGTYSLPLAREGWWVQGLERNQEAVRLARLNAADNQLAERCRFDAVAVDGALAAQLPHCDALLVDPPRKGLDATSLTAILAAPPATMLYLSCDPATLARDLRQLQGAGGYTIEQVQPIDFFPHTSHVETLAVLRRNRS